MSGRLRARLRRRDERGAATIFFVALSVMLFVVAGLVVDGGLAINARGRAADDAEQAARAGAQEIDLDTLRASGTVVLNSAAAQAAAENFLVARGYTGAQANAVVAGNTVTVTVQHREQTALLSLIGIQHFDVEASAQSRPAVGIAAEIP